MQALIERLEKLEIASTAPSTIAQRKEFGPYDPPVLPPTLKATISEICQQDEVDQEQFSELRLNIYLSPGHWTLTESWNCFLACA